MSGTGFFGGIAKDVLEYEEGKLINQEIGNIGSSISSDMAHRNQQVQYPSEFGQGYPPQAYPQGQNFYGQG